MLVETDAVVLHVQDYLESSRIVRLATHESGVISALARGARRPRSRFGPALDLFTGGVAQLAMRPGRDLQTLTGFDALRARHALGGHLARFTAASALAELALRFVGEVPNGGAFDALVAALDAVGGAAPDAVAEAALAGAWHLVAELGFAP
ncbi:MAG TPA: DNA repair protein RecO, partial [Gemmatimonadaceae bacterium]